MMKTIHSRMFVSLFHAEESGVRLPVLTRTMLLACVTLLSLNVAKAQDYSAVYMIGGATPAGWSLESAVGMLPVSGEDAAFTWEGHLNKDEFKFVSSRNWYWPGFLATKAGETVEAGKSYGLRYSADMIDEDYKFVPAEEGDYKITVDLKALRMTVEKGRAQTMPEALWIEGSAVPAGVRKMTVGSDGTFSYRGRLTRGTLRVITTEMPADDTEYYVPQWEEPDIQDGSPIMKTTDASAPGYWVEVPSDYYRIRLNLQSLDFSAAPFRAPYSLFLVGGATNAGWNTQDAVPFEQDIDNPYQYTCCAELKIRQNNDEPNLFKILGQPDWGPYSLHPTTSEQPITEAERVVENGDDTKWSVPEDKQGWYQLTVDIWNGTIKAEAQQERLGVADGGQQETTRISDAVAAGTTFNVRSNGGTVMLDSPVALSNARLVSLSGSGIAVSGKRGSRIVLGCNVTPGVYVVSADTDEGQTCVQKVVVK